MEHVSEGPTIERHFGHVSITWQIKSFCLKTCKEDFLIYTPEFCVDGLYETKWKIVLNTKSKQNNENRLVFILERTGSDTEPDYVYVDLNIGTTRKDGKRFNKTFSNTWGRKGSHKIPAWTIVEAQKMLIPSSLDYGTLNFDFHMIVDFDNCSRGVNKISDDGFKTLSEDFINLYKVGNNYDVILRLNKGCIYAHKAILCSRSQVLASMVENECKEMVLDMKDYDYETMHNLIEYFYSGNIDYITKKPSIKMFGYVTYFNITDLMQLYNMHTLDMSSDMEVQDHTFLWTLRNFKKFTGDYVSSPVFTADYMDAAWRLSVGENILGFITMHAEVIRGTMPKCGFVEFSVVHNDIRKFTKTLQLPGNDEHRIIGEERFITRRFLDSELDKIGTNDLNIAFTVKIHNGIGSTRITYSLGYAPVPLDQFYLIFSKHLWDAYETGKFADITIEVDRDSFKVHKCILSARSHSFATMFKETTEDKVSLRNIKSGIFSVILCYIYTGTYESFELEDVVEVYRAAHAFSLTTLKRRCSAILRENLTAETVHKVLMLAEEYEEMELKNAALDFINQNGCASDDDKKSKHLVVGKFRDVISVFTKFLGVTHLFRM